MTALAPAEVDEPASPAGTVAAVRAELEAVEQSSSALGAMALALASRIDSGRETGSAMATLTRELRLTMDEARASGRHASSIAEKLSDELAFGRSVAVDLEVGLICPPAYLWVPEYAETDGDLAAPASVSPSTESFVT